MKIKKVLVINLGWEQQPLIDSLLQMPNIELYGIHYDTNGYQKNAFTEILVTDLRNLPTIITFSDKFQFDAVISDQCDYSSFVQSLIAEKQKLKGSSISSILISTNKLLQRQKAKENNVLQPNFSLSTSIGDIKKFVAKYGYPVIVKPLDNRGSFGVNKINNESEIEAAFYDAILNAHSRQVIVEEFIEGVHITVDGYVFKDIGCVSLALASKKLLSKQQQVAMDIIYPGELEQEVIEKAMRVNEEVNNSLGYHFGMTHSEYMIDKNNDVYLIETANRGGGVYTSEIIVPQVSGIDILQQYISDVLDLKQSFFKEEIQSNQVILKFFALQESGFIESIDGVDKILAHENVLKFRLNKQVGEYVEPILNDGNRHGFIIVKAEGNVRALAERILNNLQITFKK